MTDPPSPESRRAVYPGTFDPLTRGHLDLIRRATELFDFIDVLVADNVEKTSWFAADERVDMIRHEVSGWRCVSVSRFQGLVVDYMRTHDIRFMLRGVRTVSDFEYEYQMAMTNRSLLPTADTVFMMPSLCYSFTSSRLIKEILLNRGDIAEFVPSRIARLLQERMAQRLHPEGGSGP
ncbi:MAG: pantetheine-phosphate adenylyltransferase [Planctomycetes bacterium]|nr:pantetheine-phosphate adenylyltransferase [Planctomycetota bacterium]